MSEHNPWLRLYTEAVDDEKLRLLAFEDRWHFIALLCCKGAGVLDSVGSDALFRRKVAVKLGLQVRELDEVARRLAEVSLIDEKTLQPLAWCKRQFQSDNDKTAADRKRRQREKAKKLAELESVTAESRVSSPVTMPNVTRTETETETETERLERFECVSEKSAALTLENTHTPRRFVAPSVEEVRAYCQTRGNQIDPNRFVDWNASKGWMIGKNHMRDWKAAIRTWERNQVQEPTPGGPHGQTNRPVNAAERQERFWDERRAEYDAERRNEKVVAEVRGYLGQDLG